jgi:hypothetical protein
MQLFVKHNKTLTYNVEPDISLKDFREMISNRVNVALEYFFLVHNGKIIEKGKLSDYNVGKDSTIHVNIRPVPVFN